MTPIEFFKETSANRYRNPPWSWWFDLFVKIHVITSDGVFTPKDFEKARRQLTKHLCDHNRVWLCSKPPFSDELQSLYLLRNWFAEEPSNLNGWEEALAAELSIWSGSLHFPREIKEMANLKMKGHEFPFISDLSTIEAVESEYGYLAAQEIQQLKRFTTCNQVLQAPLSNSQSTRGSYIVFPTMSISLC